MRGASLEFLAMCPLSLMKKTIKIPFHSRCPFSETSFNTDPVAA